MVDSILLIAVLILLTLFVGATTQWIVHKLNPPKPNEPKPVGVAKSVGQISPVAFIVTLIINILLVLSQSPLAFLIIASGPAMIVFGIMSIMYFVSARK